VGVGTGMIQGGVDPVGRRASQAGRNMRSPDPEVRRQASKDLRSFQKRNNPVLNAMSRISRSRVYRWGGRGLIGVGTAVTLGAELNDADNHYSEAVINTGVRTVLAVAVGAGAARIGVLAGGLCGPAVVVCAPVFGVALGAAGAVGGDMGGQWVTEQEWYREPVHRISGSIDQWTQRQVRTLWEEVA